MHAFQGKRIDPAARRAVKPPRQIPIAGLEPCAQQVCEEPVVAVLPPFAVQRHQKQIVVLQMLKDCLPPVEWALRRRREHVF